MVKRILLLSAFGILLLLNPGYAGTYVTIKDGEWSSKTTWLNNKVPSLGIDDTIFIYHSVEIDPGNTSSNAYIYIDTAGKLLETSNQFHNFGKVDVYGYFYIPNTFHNHATGVVNIYSAGWMWAGINWWNEGLVMMTGGYICWKVHGFKLPSNLIQGWGTICDESKYPDPFNPGPLPIQLLDFQVYCAYGPVEISWTTVNEENNDHFSIERSSDLLKWEVVATEKGAGTSHGIQHYSAYDLDSHPGISYYRLVQTDFDGMVTIFEDKWLRFTDCRAGLKTEFALFPNPVLQGNELTVLPGLSIEGMTTTSLYDMAGNQVMSSMIEHPEKGRPIIIQTSCLKTGVYLLVIKGKNFNTKRVFVVK